MIPNEATHVLKFWFQTLTPEQWFVKDATLDQHIKEQFLTLHQQVASGETYLWRETIQGRLAEIIVLDQFSRNMFRDQKEAFQYDALALILSQEAISTGEVDQLSPDQRAFLYMPWMHSESVKIHEKALELFSDPELATYYPYEVRHKEIIDRFGRYPHRNKQLERVSTPEECAFLQEPNSSF